DTGILQQPDMSALSLLRVVSRGGFRRGVVRNRTAGFRVGSRRSASPRDRLIETKDRRGGSERTYDE
ncbi:hypothetical protein GTC6_06334, partial [Gordonia terrae C-6]